jgi:hypothetical protein
VTPLSTTRVWLPDGACARCAAVTAPDPTGDDPVMVARRCWDDLLEQRRRRQISLDVLEKGIRRAFPQDAPARSTLQDWFVNRKSLPDKLLFLELVRLLELDVQEWAYRWEEWDRARLQKCRAGATAHSPRESADGVVVTASAEVPEQRTRRRRPLAIGSVTAAGLVVVGTALLVGSPGAEGTPQAPVVSAVAANRGAHADFHRDEGRFLVFDDAGDGKSAILQAKVDGTNTNTWYNTRGMTDPQHPPKMIELADTAAGLEFRVCVGEYGSSVPEKSCGEWTAVTR